MAKEKGSKKIGREKEKRKRNGSAISAYVRGKVDFNGYVKMGGLESPAGRHKSKPKKT